MISYRTNVLYLSKMLDLQTPNPTVNSQPTVQAFAAPLPQNQSGEWPTPHHSIDLPPSVSSGFPALDYLTGCGGIPLGHLTMLTGNSVDGKEAVAAQTLANIQFARKRDIDSVAVLDFAQTMRPNDLDEFGVDLRHCDLIRLPHPSQTVRLIFSLICGYGYRGLLINGLGAVLARDEMAEVFRAAAPKITWALGQTSCAMICLEDATGEQNRRLTTNGTPLAQIASLHIDLYDQVSMDFGSTVKPTSAQAQLRYSQWAAGGSCHLSLPRPVWCDQLYASNRVDQQGAHCVISI